jgi:hypothetical protein
MINPTIEPMSRGHELFGGLRARAIRAKVVKQSPGADTVFGAEQMTVITLTTVQIAAHGEYVAVNHIAGAVSGGVGISQGQGGSFGAQFQDCGQSGAIGPGLLGPLLQVGHFLGEGLPVQGVIGRPDFAFEGGIEVFQPFGPIAGIQKGKEKNSLIS